MVKITLMLLSAVYFVESQEKFMIWKWPYKLWFEWTPHEGNGPLLKVMWSALANQSLRRGLRRGLKPSCEQTGRLQIPSRERTGPSVLSAQIDFSKVEISQTCHKSLISCLIPSITVTWSFSKHYVVYPSIGKSESIPHLPPKKMQKVIVKTALPDLG